MRWGWLLAPVLAVVVIGCQSTLPPPSSLDPDSVPDAPRRGTIEISVVEGVPEEMASRIVDVALAFGPTAGVHAGQQFEVTEVSAVDGEDFGGTGDYVRVVIEFAQPLPFDVWPDEPTCAIDRESNDVTGIAWLLSFDTEAVEAYSPQWDYAIDCVPA
jgi:hypothetical protein